MLKTLGVIMEVEFTTVIPAGPAHDHGRWSTYDHSGECFCGVQDALSHDDSVLGALENTNSHTPLVGSAPFGDWGIGWETTRM